jgi:hypothetical protein
MGERHMHADVIIAWANGEEIEYEYNGEWHWITHSDPPAWLSDRRYRIKPKLVKKEAWVNVYPKTEGFDLIGYAYSTEERANHHSIIHKRKTCIRIEWEEEE